MPRPPKPKEQRQNRERADVGLLLLPTAEPPPPPAGMLRGTRDSWASFWRSPLSSAVRRDADTQAVVRLFWLYDQRTRYVRASVGKALVKGSTGQVVMNPLLKQLPTIDAEILALEDRFGLSPLARLKLGITLGEGGGTLDDLNDALDSSAEEPEDELRVLSLSD